MVKKIAHRQHVVNSQESGSTEPGPLATRSAEGDAFSAFVVQVFRLNSKLLDAGDALAAPAGQTSARWRVLAAIEAQPLTVVQIARMWGFARQSVQRVANQLVHAGYAEYLENPRHRRAQLVALTPQGRAALQQVQAAQREWANTLGAAIGEDQLRQASAILARVLAALEQD